MKAASFDIIEREMTSLIRLAGAGDFQLQAGGQIDATEILTNPAITLYSLDFENSQAVFVETAPEVNLYRAPFLYFAQFENAQRVLTLPFATLKRLAQDIDLPGEKLIFIHSVGRAGSTLASQIFTQAEGVDSLSEPDALTTLVRARSQSWADEAELAALLDATMRLICRTEAPKAWVIKGRSFVIELADWLHALYPGARHLFLYRDAESWLQSSLSAYMGDRVGPEVDMRSLENGIRQTLAPFTPLIAGFDTGQHLTIIDLLALTWLSTMERYERLNQEGIEMMAIDYMSWHTTPRETAIAMLDYANCLPPDLAAVYEALTRDSQAGSYLSQDAVSGHKIALSANDHAQLQRRLQNHPTIQHAAFRASNTWEM